jgi:hypothetical protein
MTDCPAANVASRVKKYSPLVWLQEGASIRLREKVYVPIGLVMGCTQILNGQVQALLMAKTNV